MLSLIINVHTSAPSPLLKVSLPGATSCFHQNLATDQTSRFKRNRGS